MTSVVVAATLLTACSSTAPPPHQHSPQPDPDPSAVVRSLGAVSIPTASAGPSTATASPGRPAVLAIGEPVQIALPDHTTAVVTALGPQQVDARAAEATPPKSTRAVLTLRAFVTHGQLRIAADELSSRDQAGNVIRLTPVGAAHRAATKRQPAAVTVSGRFGSGAAQVTWRHHGHVLAIWTFNIELD